jgi:hypothetical protein
MNVAQIRGRRLPNHLRSPHLDNFYTRALVSGRFDLPGFLITESPADRSEDLANAAVDALGDLKARLGQQPEQSQRYSPPAITWSA